MAPRRRTARTASSGRERSAARAASATVRSAASGTSAAKRTSRSNAVGGGAPAGGVAHAASTMGTASSDRAPGIVLLRSKAVMVHPQRERQEGLEPARRLDLLRPPVLFSHGLVEARRGVDELLETCRIEEQALRRVRLDVLDG